jgi:hypothetical protein
MSNERYPVQHPQTASQVYDDQVVIVLADSGQVTVLNDTGALVWQLSDGRHSLEQIAQALVEEYDVPHEVAVQDVQALVNQLVEIQALVLYEQPVSE